MIVSIKRSGVTMTVKDPPASLALDLFGRIMRDAPSAASVNASAQGVPGESEQAVSGNLFESTPPERDPGLVSGFLADRTESAQQFWEPVARMSTAYLAWCSDRGLEPRSHYAFAQELRNLKFRQGRSRRIKCGNPVCPKCAGPEKGHQLRSWEGVRLKSSDGALALVKKPSEAAS